MGTLFNITKHSGTLGNMGKESLIKYLTTDAADYILVGSAEDEILILKGLDALSSQTKNSGSLISINKN